MKKIIVILVLLVSCNNKKVKESNEILLGWFSSENGSVKYRICRKDSVSQYLKIEYESVLDTIVSRVNIKRGQNNEARYLYFPFKLFLKGTKGLIKEDTIYAKNNREFVLSILSSIKSGEYIIEGELIDLVYLGLHEKEIRLIEKKTELKYNFSIKD